MAARTDEIAKRTRAYRRLHKWVAVPLFAFLFLIGLTGVLLGWKKQANLTPPTQKGSSVHAEQWLPLDSLLLIARTYAADSLLLDPTIDRIDIRPKSGSAKILFPGSYTELQIDLTSGQVLAVGKRWNDLIEHIHDGTIIDRLLGTDDDPFKIGYTTMTSLGLMLLAISGFWLWLNPRRIRKIKKA